MTGGPTRHVGDFGHIFTRIASAPEPSERRRYTPGPGSARKRSGGTIEVVPFPRKFGNINVWFVPPCELPESWLSLRISARRVL